MLAKDLIPVKSWEENIREYLLFDYLTKIVQSELQKSSELEQQAETIEKLREKLNIAYRSPVLWVINILYEKYASRVIGTAIVVTLLFITWRKVTTG